MHNNIVEAFHKICDKAINTGLYYVSLVENRPYYGGPEEGGWWGRDQIVIAYQSFNSEEAANAAVLLIEELAADLSATALQEYGDKCLRECEWCEARGLDADYLPEVDGESTFDVYISEELPQHCYGEREFS